ncbi:hypothetical protein [Yersinia enterocolitica]|jgi:hypothetical protein|uniref:hypothetical protein n=1 Tax=Yersinia enterocolitica TaxID=630 RepID=UPI003D028FD4
MKVFRAVFDTLSPQLQNLKKTILLREGGIIKRIDENRELLALLYNDVPELLKEKPWVLGWLKSQDVFLSELSELAGIEKSRSYQSDYPRAFPTLPPIKTPDGVTESWFEHAWPLWKIALLLETPKSNSLNGIASHLNHHVTALDRVINPAKGDYIVGGDEPLKWSMRSLVTKDGNSFFAADTGCGGEIISELFDKEFSDEEMVCNAENDRVYILLQGIKTTHPETLSSYLETVIAKIGQGLNVGCMHDDDSGWMFRVVRAKENA